MKVSATAVLINEINDSEWRVAFDKTNLQDMDHFQLSFYSKRKKTFQMTFS